jgi:hypothetical protein
MAIKGQSRQILAGYPVVNPRGADDEVVQISDYLIPTGGVAAGDIVEMGAIPEGCVPTNMRAVSEDLDSNGTPTVTLDIGILSGTYGDATSVRTMGNEFLAASTVGQAGGIADGNKAAGLLLAPSLDLVPYGIKFPAGTATPIVGARVRLIARFKPAPVSV